jgi:hypothetical protein
MPKNISQTARQKIVNRYAPDAFILLNQQPYLVNSDHKIYFNNDIQSININGSIDAPPAHASFTLVIPRASEDKYFKNGRLIIQNMMEVQIFLKGRYHVVGESGSIEVPPPIQQFHGVVTTISDDYSGDSHNVSIECKDMLYWMQITKMNARPSILTAQSTGALVTPLKSVFQGTPPKDIIKFLVDYAYGGARKTPNGANISAAFVPETFNSSVSFTMGVRNNPFNNISTKAFVQIEENAVQEYWKNRFKLTADQELDTNVIDLMIYSFSSRKVVQEQKQNVVNPLDGRKSTGGSAQDARPEQTPFINDSSNAIFKVQNTINQKVAAATGKTLNEQKLEGVLDDLISAAHPYGEISSVDTISSEYSTLLDMAIHVKDYIGYEFYMSLDGQVIFKPPFFNLDVKPFRPFVIKDEDVIAFNLHESDEVFTVLAARGNISDQVHTSNSIQEMGVAMDAMLARQYGLRVQQTDIQMIANLQGMKQSEVLALYAQNEMDRHNARRFQGSVTIPGTPEVKMGYPVYIESRDCYGYVTAVTHSFSFGSSFQTTLTVEALRYNSTLGKNMVIRPGPLDPNSLNSSPQKNYESMMVDHERRGNIRGTGTNMRRTRVVSPANDASETTATSFIRNQVQRVTDKDGYELIGVINYGADLLIDPFGQFQPKVNALNLDTKTTSVNVIADMRPRSNDPQPKNFGSVPVDNTPQPSGEAIGNIQRNDQKGQ